MKVQQKIASSVPGMIITGMNEDKPSTSDIQETVGKLIGLQSSPCAKSPCLNAGFRLKESGSTTIRNIKKQMLKKIEDQEDIAEEEEDEQTDEAALNQNKDYRVNIISQPSIVQALLQLEYKRSLTKGMEAKKQKLQAQMPLTNQTWAAILNLKLKLLPQFQNFKLSPNEAGRKSNRLKPNHKTQMNRMKWSRSPDRAGTLQPKEINVEISLQNKEMERADKEMGNGTEIKNIIHRMDMGPEENENMIDRRMKAENDTSIERLVQQNIQEQKCEDKITSSADRLIKLPQTLDKKSVSVSCRTGQSKDTNTKNQIMRRDNDSEQWSNMRTEMDDKENQDPFPWIIIENYVEKIKNERHSSKAFINKCEHQPSGPVADIGRDLLKRCMKMKGFSEEEVNLLFIEQKVSNVRYP
ncbi:MAG: hypothetical protein EZS28_001696 [Streblomastix strix]|uniref:Uncharacterized protein n=1 Tax=Streblomastix strix TaxID=222440 RepID=A0A5J4X7S6_9EUKA|nr:MAG: hypothetical protein EZS28_001696 [Streblomastix strix]